MELLDMMMVFCTDVTVCRDLKLRMNRTSKTKKTKTVMESLIRESNILQSLVRAVSSMEKLETLSYLAIMAVKNIRIKPQKYSWEKVHGFAKGA